MKIKRPFGPRQNKPNTNPKQTQFVVSLPVLSAVEGSKGGRTYFKGEKNAADAARVFGGLK